MSYKCSKCHIELKDNLACGYLGALELCLYCDNCGDIKRQWEMFKNKKDDKFTHEFKTTSCQN